MKKEKICIHKDEKYEAQVLSEAPKVQQALQDLVNQFNALQLGDIAPNELDDLARDPRGLYQSRIDRKIEIPAGLNKEKYLQMCDLPDFKPVQQAYEKIHKHEHYSVDAYSLEGNRVQINEDIVNQLAQSHNVFISTEQEISLYRDMISFMDQLNRFDDMLGESIVDASVKNPLQRLVFDVVQANAVGTRFKYSFSIQKYKNILSGHRVRVLAPTGS